MHSSDIIPFPRSYWVIPGKLLAGHIPTNKDPDVSKTKIQNLLDLGIKTFINLQEEFEVDFDGNTFPKYHQHLPGDAYFYRKSIKDLNIPTASEMVDILNCIDESIHSKKPVYVHCWGGIGRTGTVIGCFLIRHKMATPENVFQMIHYLRRTDPENHRKSPETNDQENFVLRWKENW